MRLKTAKPLALFLLISSFSFGQGSGNISDFLLGGPEDAETMLNNYMAPALKGWGMGYNNGWYNTAKPHESLGFDLTVTTNFAYVPTEQQVFGFVPQDYNFTRLSSGSDQNLPTVAGGPTTSELIVAYDTLGQTIELARYGAIDGVGDELPAFKNTVPSVVLQAGLGIVKGTELKVRWMPEINQDDLSLKYFGFGVMHSISQWIPVFKDLPIDISGFVGYTNIEAVYNIPENTVGDGFTGDNMRAEFKINTFSYQALASVKVSVLTAYIGLGMDSYTTNINMLGSYSYSYPLIGDVTFTDPVQLEQSGNNGFRSTFGARLKLAIITFHADYTFREYNTLSMGVGFSFR